jgi:predicted MPP superfamily phosphohydrolase
MAPPGKTEDPPLPSAATGEAGPRLRGRSRRIGRRVLVVAGIILALNAFTCATWSFFSGRPGALASQVISGALVLGFVGAMLVGFRYSSVWLRTLYAVSAVWIGALNFAFFAALGCWLTEGIVRWAGWPVPRLTLAEVWFGAAFLAVGFGLINARWLRVTRVTVALAHLPEVWHGRTIALVSDLHLGHVLGPGFVRKIITRLRALQPDAVLISGDMFDGTPIGLDRLVADWRGFRPGRGIFYVTGNHDEFAERRIYLEAVRRTGIRVLDNEKISIDGLQIVGVHDSEAHDPAVLRAVLERAQLAAGRPSILVAHQPVNLAVAEAAGISLQLSGHTHRGQVWPWRWLVARIYGRFAYGLNRFGRLQVYTSSGAGTWGPPLRVGTRSEIVLIRLEGEDAAVAAARAARAGAAARG